MGVIRKQTTTWSIDDGDGDGGLFTLEAGGDSTVLYWRRGREAPWCMAVSRPAELGRIGARLAQDIAAGSPVSLSVGGVLWFAEHAERYQYSTRMHQLLITALADLDDWGTLAPWA